MNLRFLAVVGSCWLLVSCSSSKPVKQDAVPLGAQSIVNAHVLDPDAQLVSGVFADAATGRKVQFTPGGYSQGWELSGDGLEEYIAQYEVTDTKHPEILAQQHLGWFLGSRQNGAIATTQYGGLVLCAGETLTGVARVSTAAVKVETSQRTITVTTVANGDRRPSGLRVDPPAAGCAPAPTLVPVASTVAPVPQAPAEPGVAPVAPVPSAPAEPASSLVAPAPPTSVG